MGRLLILILFWIIFIAQVSYSQKSATAVMQVSVRVVQGTSVDVKQPELISFVNNKRSDLGQMNLKGINRENALISVSGSVNIRNKEGNDIDVAVNSEYEENKDRNTIYKLSGSPNKQMENGIYQGRLITTIEYL